MKNTVKPAVVVTLTAPAGGVVSGLGYIIGALFALATTTESAGDLFEGATAGGYELPLAAADTPAVGDLAYWDDTSKELSTVATIGFFQVGVFLTAHAAGAGQVALLRLDGKSVVAEA